jgi:hypothetical protein
VLNESYTCYRLAPDGNVYPSIVVRQKPFNNRHYESFADKVAIHTKFLDLPRWRISPDLITSLNIGRSDSGRINFVQVFSRSLSIDENFNQAAQIDAENFYEDKDDIIRHGRKPYIVNCNYDYPGSDSELRAREWALLVADWVLNGHLKMNGRIQTIGIEEPICIGDNLELDDIVYHIESIGHNMSIAPNGAKMFRTNLSLSMGISEKSTKSIPVYAEMDHTDTKKRREEDFAKERGKMLPGFSDTQDLPDSKSRKRGEEVQETEQATFTNPTSQNKGKKTR